MLPAVFFPNKNLKADGRIYLSLGCSMCRVTRGDERKARRSHASYAFLGWLDLAGLDICPSSSSSQNIWN